MYNINKVEEDLIDIAKLVAKYYGNRIVIVGHISMLLQYKDSYRHTSDVDLYSTDASVFEEFSDTIEDIVAGLTVIGVKRHSDRSQRINVKYRNGLYKIGHLNICYK